MRWYWEHVLSFDPRPALRDVHVPVLGVFGEADPLTEASVAAESMRRALAQGGNSDVTVKIFPGAGHSLNDASGGRMAPGVFDTLGVWLRANVGAAPAASR
jgi:pimeloyl-ACP methyl ester carboxylesterase